MGTSISGRSIDQKIMEGGQDRRKKTNWFRIEGANKSEAGQTVLMIVTQARQRARRMGIGWGTESASSNTRR